MHFKAASGLLDVLVLFVINLDLKTNNVVSSQQYATRKTKYGEVIGKIVEIPEIETTAEVFLGVPYAEPPINNLRFQYPIAPKKWTTPLPCTEFRKICLQLFNLDKNVKESEDCLTLNIFLPHQNSSEVLFPVLVWLHGGSYFMGAANNFPIQTTIKNLVSKNIVLVFVHYRLGALGYMSLGNSSLPGNYGIEDQLFAIKWVNENINYFNGDPNKITLTGESAGAASASLLAISDKAKGLFQQVLLQSGSSLAPWAVSNQRTIANTEKILHALNCTVGQNETDFRNCLQNVRYNEFADQLYTVSIHSRVFSTQKNAINHWILPGVTPVVDKYRGSDSILEDSPSNLMQRNARLPLVLGITNYETLPYIVNHCRIWPLVLHTKEVSKRVLSIDLNVLNYKFPYTAENENVIEWSHFLPSSIFQNVDFVYQAIQNYYCVQIGLNTSEMVKIMAKINGDHLFFSPAVLEAIYYAQRNVSVKFYVYSDEMNAHLLSKSRDECFDFEDYPNAAAHGFDTIRLFESTSVSFPYLSTDQWETTNLPMTNIISDMITSYVVTGTPRFNYTNENKWKTFSIDDKVGLQLNSDKGDIVDVYQFSRSTLWHKILPFVDNLHC